MKKFVSNRKMLSVILILVLIFVFSLSVAYAIVRSCGGNKEFPDHPQIAPEVKCDLAMSLHRLDDALQELLVIIISFLDNFFNP